MTDRELKIVARTENITGESIMYEDHKTIGLDKIKNVYISNFLKLSYSLYVIIFF